MSGKRKRDTHAWTNITIVKFIHVTDPYGHRVAARAAAEAAIIAGTTITGFPAPASISNHPETSPAGPSEVVEMPQSLADLLIGVHGHCIDICAPTITWPNEVHAVLPFLDDGSGSNVLENNMESVTQLSKLPMITSASQSHVRFFTKDDINTTTFKNDLRTVLANSKIVIMSKFQLDVVMSFSMEDIQRHLGLTPGLEHSAHGKHHFLESHLLFIYIIF